MISEKENQTKAMLLVKNKSAYHTVYCFNNHHYDNDALSDILHLHYNTPERIDQLIRSGNIHTLYPDSIRLFTLGHKHYHPHITYKELGIAVDEGVKSNAHHMYIHCNEAWRHTALTI